MRKLSSPDTDNRQPCRFDRQQTGLKRCRWCPIYSSHHHNRGTFFKGSTVLFVYILCHHLYEREQAILTHILMLSIYTHQKMVPYGSVCLSLVLLVLRRTRKRHLYIEDGRIWYHKLTVSFYVLLEHTRGNTTDRRAEFMHHIFSSFLSIT